MRVLKRMAFFSLVLMSVSFKEQENHDLPDLKMRSEATAKAGGFLFDQFVPCSSKDPNWKSENGIRIKQFLTFTYGKKGFSPAYEGAEGAECSLIAVDEKDNILGKVQPVAQEGDRDPLDYTFVSGDLLGIGKPDDNGKRGGLYMFLPPRKLAPGEPPEAPIPVLAPCKFQDGTEEQLVLLDNGRTVFEPLKNAPGDI
jgi:hypothetical protein